jgi:hypothetical protein
MRVVPQGVQGHFVFTYDHGPLDLDEARSYPFIGERRRHRVTRGVPRLMTIIDLASTIS